MESALSDDGGSLRVSLGELNCVESTGGVYCSGVDDALTYDGQTWDTIEYSSVPLTHVGQSPSIAAVASMVESLRSITVNKVVVTKLDISQGNTSLTGTYAISGSTYDITFIKASYNSMFAATTDLNDYTWNPTFSSLFYEVGVGVPSGTIATERFDVPTLVVDDAYLGNGWVSEVSTKVNGYEVDEGQTVAVEVTMNGQDYSKQGVTFNYILQATVNKIVPNHGPMTGGTEIIIHGSNFVQSPDLVCQFGDAQEYVVNVVTYFNSSCIICVSPIARL